MRVALLLVVTGCFTKPPEPSGGRPITLTSPAASALDGFPVSIVVADAHGGDIVFRDEAGALLPCEIVSYADGNLEAWVRVPTLAASPAETHLMLDYGGGVCDPTAMWSDFAGAWHLDAPTNSPEHDSAGHYDLVTGEGYQLPDATTGVIGGGRDFSMHPVGQQLCGMRPPPAGSPVQFTESESFGFEIWVKERSVLGMFDTALNKGGASAQQIGFDMELGDYPWYTNLSDGGATSPEGMNLASGTPALDTWYLVSVVVDREHGMRTTYANGLFVANRAISVGSLVADNPVCIGWNGDPFDGVMDEPRIFRGTRTLDYFLAEYQNVVGRGDFVHIDVSP